MLHSIKSFFNFNLKGSYTQNTLNTSNSIKFRLLKIINSLVRLFLTPFFTNVEIAYRLLTKVQFLPVKMLPAIFRNFFILSNLRNNRKNGLNFLRLKKYKSIHNF